MSKTLYYKQPTKRNIRKVMRLTGLLIALFGVISVAFFFFPLLSWQLYFGPAYASQPLKTPIPTYNVLNKNSIKSLVLASANMVSGVDYTNADNWYPAFRKTNESHSVSFYSLSIPSINIENAIVSTIDTDLKSHLINFNGTAVPPASGTSIVFGHSTLPQLYNPKDYKTILANAHLLKVGDNIMINTNNTIYTYKIFSITVVEPEDTSVLAQDYSGSFLTIITCTPPGTIWKRLIVKAQLEKG